MYIYCTLDRGLYRYGVYPSSCTSLRAVSLKTRPDKPSFARLSSIAQRLSCKYQRCRNFGWMLKLDGSASLLLRKNGWMA